MKCSSHMRKYKFNHFHHDVFNEILGVLRFEAERNYLQSGAWTRSLDVLLDLSQCQEIGILLNSLRLTLNT